MLVHCIGAHWASSQAFSAIDESIAGQWLLALALVVQHVSTAAGHTRSSGETRLAIGGTAPTSPGLEVGVIFDGTGGQALGAQLEERELAVRSNPFNAGSEAIVQVSERTTVYAVAPVEESDRTQSSADALRVLILAHLALGLKSTCVGSRVVGEAGLATEALCSRGRAGSAGRLAGLADPIHGEESSRTIRHAGILVEGAQAADALITGDNGAGRADQLASSIGEGKRGVEAGRAAVGVRAGLAASPALLTSTVGIDEGPVWAGLYAPVVGEEEPRFACDTGDGGVEASVAGRVARGTGRTYLDCATGALRYALSLVSKEA